MKWYIIAWLLQMNSDYHGAIVNTERKHNGL